jgi:small subunit ribosomal protein S2
MSSAEKVTLQDLFEAGVHFGHQRRRWHPQMAPYIFRAEGGVHILDLAKTRECLINAARFLQQTARSGGAIIFVGTKRQAKETVRGEAERCGALHITERWLGGLLTNFSHVKINLERLNELTAKREKGEFSHYTKKERLLIDREIEKLEKLVGGVRTLTELPAALVLASARKENVAVREAVRKRIPVVAIADTNSDPTPITYPIPANDDSRKSLTLIFKLLADAVLEGYQKKVEGEKPAIAEAAEIENLGLSTRSLNALKKAGIKTAEQLQEMSEEELMAVKGLGEKSVEDILRKLPK